MSVGPIKDSSFGGEERPYLNEPRIQDPIIEEILNPFKSLLTIESDEIQQIADGIFTHQKIHSLTEELQPGRFITVGLYRDPSKSTYLLGQTAEGERIIGNYSEKKFISSGSFANVDQIDLIYSDGESFRTQSMVMKMGSPSGALVQHHKMSAALWKKVHPDAIKDQDILEYLESKFPPEKAQKSYESYVNSKAIFRDPSQVQKLIRKEYYNQLYLCDLKKGKEIPAIPAPYHSLIELSEGDEKYGILMPLQKGTLADLMESGKLRPQEKESIADQLVTGLDWMIQQGVVLSDLKPDNILFDENPLKVYFSDFDSLTFIPVMHEHEFYEGKLENFEFLKTKSLNGKKIVVTFLMKLSAKAPAYISEEAVAYCDDLYHDLKAIKAEKKPTLTHLKSIRVKYPLLKVQLAISAQFSLGIILYKLFTGVHPFQHIGMRGISAQTINEFFQHQEQHFHALLNSDCQENRAHQILSFLHPHNPF